MQAFGGGEATGADTVREAARAAGRGGSRLPDGMRTTMENAFGTPLDHVRVKVDEQAAASIDAKAYTVGTDIVVQSASVLRDVETMAHEIHHTTQLDAPAGLSDPGDGWEREASEVGARVARGQSVHHHTGDGGEHQDQGVQCAAVQRRVGFEFESQWRVRDHNDLTDQDERNYQNEVAERDALRGARVLATIAAQKPYAHLLEPSEKDAPAEELKSKWLTPVPGGEPGENLPTDEGAARLGKLRQKSATEYEQLMTTVELPLLMKNLIRETPVRGRDIPKMGTVGRGRNYRLTSDVSPTGGSALEWVTDPLSTRDEVVEVMTAITSVSAALDARKDAESFSLADVRVPGFDAEPGMRVFPLNGELVYTPQMTGGFKLSELPRLLEYLQLPDQAPRFTGRSAFEQRKEARQDLHQDSLQRADTIRRSAEEQARALPEEITRGEPTSELVGLVTLLGSYLAYGSELGDKANSKSIAGGMMSRTSFAHNFTLLPHPLRVYYRANPGDFTAFVLKAAGLPGSGDVSLYSQAVEHGEAGHRERKQIPLTRSEWLDGIPVGKDLLRNYKHLTEEEKNQVGDRKEGWEHIHGSLGALGTVDDKVGRPGEEAVALVAELRRMAENLRTADLRPLALAAYDLVQRLNEERTLKYKKNGR
ncbi:DUF4157 domain-containing protein [Streptomyces sp. NPDC090023]|uniref:eCIS core domain-containing protein n=1 Tax=unclassified Streptomyces TaxID=2593676 RepID=UPI00381A534E